MRNNDKDLIDRLIESTTKLNQELQIARRDIALAKQFPSNFTITHTPMPRPHIVTPVFEIVHTDGRSSVFHLPGSRIGQYNVEYPVVHPYLPIREEYKLRMTLEFHWEDHR